MQSSSVEHQGVVHEVLTGLVRVRILSETACSSCHAKGVCNVSDSESKYIDVSVDEKGFNVGDSVLVSMCTTDGYRALFFAYILPFILVFVGLIVFLLFFNELLSGLLSLGLLIPYYSLLFILKQRLSNSFTFSLKRL